MSGSSCSIARFSAGAALLAAALTLGAAAVEVDQIPSPRPAGWSVDLTGQISASALGSIDRLGDRVHAETGAEIAVVVVDSVGGRDPRGFATELFNRWGIGDATEHNGVLVFAALGDRAVEIVLGDGLDHPSGIRISDDIMQQVILPAFRRDDPSSAVLEGALACADRLLGMARDSVTEPAGALVSTQLEAPINDRADPGFDASESGGGPGWRRAFVWLLGALGVGGAVWRIRQPARCGTCRVELERLGEAEEEPHLSDSERLEESLDSVDYRCYGCRSCGAVEKIPRRKLFSRYSNCPRCGYRTKSRVRETLRHATYSLGGLVRVSETCADDSCGYSNVSTHSTPTRTRSSSSSSFGSSRSSGFSGGSSSGRGSSGRW